MILKVFLMITLCNTAEKHILGLWNIYEAFFIFKSLSIRKSDNLVGTATPISCSSCS